MNEETVNLATSKNLCILPWVHATVWTDGRVIPCCINQDYTFGNTHHVTVEEALDSDAANAFRAQMLSGSLPPSCYRCSQPEEQFGSLSYRQDMNRRFQQHADLITQTDPDGRRRLRRTVYLDVRFSNLCNLACIMCDEINSSLFAQKERAAGRYDGPLVRRAFSNPDHFWKFFDRHINDFEEIYFCGGEPLLLEEHEEVLRRLLNAGRTHVHLRYNTNMSRLTMGKSGTSVLDLWVQFQRVSVHASVDAFGELAEIIRRGTNWSQIEENLRAVFRASQVHPGISLGIAPTIQILNALHLKDLYFHLRSREALGDSMMVPNLLMFPAHFSIQNLSSGDKTRVISSWASLMEAANDAHEGRHLKARLIEMTNYMQLREMVREDHLRLKAWVNQTCQLGHTEVFRKAGLSFADSDLMSKP